ncbi:hypothetical protein [Streptomyces sp. NBC_01237]|uniref:hypothetical protein n=1 Tax=Streptomyces sp. NBC_01237 TaxID=2903790 RepID=UPI002DD9688F|nr:hypothetical protein [Streptomyces sp. NBC_01237]WRZ75886.1 hypothetical protein OG251_32040 [Streptomyces sp. NBC_01237]
MARGRIVAQLPLTVACALMARQVWLLFPVTAAEGAGVTWSCGVSSCGTDDLAGGAPMTGAATVVALSLLSTRCLHRAASPSSRRVRRSARDGRTPSQRGTSRLMSPRSGSWAGSRRRTGSSSRR